MFYGLLGLVILGFLWAASYWHSELLRARREARWPRFSYCNGYRDECLRWAAGASLLGLIIFATSA